MAPSTRDIKTELALMKWVKNILGPQWDLGVHEHSSVYLFSTMGSHKSYNWSFNAWCKEPLEISVHLQAKTFAALVKHVEKDLWEAIRAEFEKQSVKWQKPGDAERIDNGQRRLTSKQPALTGPTRVLTAQAARQPGKQLLLLPPPEPEVLEHLCHWPGCKISVEPNLWGCRAHWFALPASLRERIWETYRPGQEISMDPSPAYLAAAKAVQDWIKAKEL